MDYGTCYCAILKLKRLSIMKLSTTTSYSSEASATPLHQTEVDANNEENTDENDHAASHPEQHEVEEEKKAPSAQVTTNDYIAYITTASY